MKLSVHFLLFLTIGLMTGCGSDSGGSNTESQTPNVANVTIDDSLGKDIVGSWNTNYIDDDQCNYSTFISFSDDWSFSITDYRECAEADYDYSYNGSGTWDIIGGVLHTTFTESSDGNVGDLLTYSFITSSQHMAMAPDEWLYFRIGNGSGLAGTWFVDNSGCTDTFIFNTDGTWTFDSVCGNPDEEGNSTGTYTTNDGALTLMTNSGIMNLSYKLFGDSTLAICENYKLFTRD